MLANEPPPEDHPLLAADIPNSGHAARSLGFCPRPCRPWAEQVVANIEAFVAGQRAIGLPDCGFGVAAVEPLYCELDPRVQGEETGR